MDDPGGNLRLARWKSRDARLSPNALRPSRSHNDIENRVSRNSESLAVALNCGIGPCALSAEVKALDRLEIVRDLNSSYFGSKYRS